MKKSLLIIGFAFAGIFTSCAQAQLIPLTFDSAQSSIDININAGLVNDSSSSTLSGTAVIDIQNLYPPSGNAQITQLNLVADNGLDFNLFLVSVSSAPGDVAISLVTPGAPGLLSSGGSFNQLSNTIAFNGELTVQQLLQASETIDLSTITIDPQDFTSVNVTQSGNIVTISSSFTVSQTLDIGELVAEVNFVATGVAPAPTVLLGDVNLDGVVTFLDIAPFIALLSSQGFQAEADCNEDGVLNFLDIQPFIDILADL